MWVSAVITSRCPPVCRVRVGQLMGPRAKKRFAKFQALANALVGSWPSYAARVQNDISTEHPLHYLNVTYGKPYVTTALQGRWHNSHRVSLLRLYPHSFRLHHGIRVAVVGATPNEKSILCVGGQRRWR